MEKLLEKAREYTLALKEAGPFSYEDMANMSGVPQQTIRNFCTGKTSKNVGFETVVSLIVSLGGDLNEIIGYEKKKELEVTGTVLLKETYEMRMADLIKSYEERIDDIKALCELRISDIQSCCETRVADLKHNFEERLEAQKQLLLSLKNIQ